MRGLYDRWWVRRNRKSRTPGTLYLGIVGAWFRIGLLFSAVLVFSCYSPWIMFGLILPLLWGVQNYRYDKRNGYLDALHKRYLERREEMFKKVEGGDV